MFDDPFIPTFQHITDYIPIILKPVRRIITLDIDTLLPHNSLKVVNTMNIKQIELNQAFIKLGKIANARDYKHTYMYELVITKYNNFDPCIHIVPVGRIKHDKRTANKIK